MFNRELGEELLPNKIEKVNLSATSDASQPRVISAYYDWNDHRIVINLENEVTLSFPPEQAKGLVKASRAELAEIEITPSGKELRWESLDVDFNIASFFAEIFGIQTSVAPEMGRKGGSVSSEVKANAARKNGKKGGRPRKANSKEVIEKITQMNSSLSNESKVQVRGLLKIDRVSPTDAEIDAEYDDYLIEEYL